MWRQFSCEKSLLWYAKSEDCFLTLWLPLTSILFLTGTIYSSIFRCNSPTNQKLLLNLFLHFLNLDSIFNIFKKKMTLIGDIFLNLRTPKPLLNKCLKSPISEDPSTSDMVKRQKECWNQNDSTFTIFIDTIERLSDGKSLSSWYAKS